MQLAQHSEEKVRQALDALLQGLQDLGFGTDEEINGGDAVDAIGELYQDVTERILGDGQAEVQKSGCCGGCSGGGCSGSRPKG